MTRLRAILLNCATVLVNLLLVACGVIKLRRRTLSLLGIAALTASLALARIHPFGDAGLHNPHALIEPIPQQANMPAPVRELLTAKCADCHSNQTRSPFYGNLAPISWLMERHIIEGREHLNFADWNTYSADRQQVLQSKIIQLTKSGKMPLPPYRLIHWSAAITPADEQLLTAWAHTNSATQDGATSTQAPTEGNAAQGKLVFEKRCIGCHSLTTNLEGPSLGALYGRTAGQLPNFTYSTALKNSHIIWNDANLDRWLTDPDAFVPGNNMDFHVAKPQERQDLIRFFKASKTQ